MPWLLNFCSIWAGEDSAAKRRRLCLMMMGSILVEALDSLSFSLTLEAAMITCLEQLQMGLIWTLSKWIQFKVRWMDSVAASRLFDHVIASRLLTTHPRDGGQRETIDFLRSSRGASGVHVFFLESTATRTSGSSQQTKTANSSTSENPSAPSLLLALDCPTARYGWLLWGHQLSLPLYHNKLRLG